MTLQELLAPDIAIFYDRLWRRIGERSELADTIENITGIELECLCVGNRQQCVERSSVAQKMSWIAGRATSRTEDIAYCMLGLFDVNMPLLYGEGSKAFIRLQEEIISKSNDDSIFAWGLSPDDCSPYIYPDGSGMLALGPDLFAGSRYVEGHLPLKHTNIYSYSMTNQGLRFEAHDSQYVKRSKLGERTFALQLNCEVRQPGQHYSGGRIEICLAQIQQARGTKEERYWMRQVCRCTKERTWWRGKLEGSFERIGGFYVRQAGR